MRILLLGVIGQLGWELQRCLQPLGEVVALDYPEIDLANEYASRQLIRDLHPGVILNATAYTDVDRAEGEPEAAMALNAIAPGFLAEEALELRAAFIHFSTDYVFDGRKGSPYIEADPVNPLNIYGKSKLAGERAIQQVGGSTLILRTSWLYSLRRESFVTKVLKWAREKQSLSFVTDQVGSPTWSRMLAEITAQVLAQAHYDDFGWLGERRGIYHLAGDGVCNRLEWAQAIFHLDPNPGEQVVKQLTTGVTSDFPSVATRPLFSALDCARFQSVFGLRLPPWKEALRLAMEIS